MRVAIPVEHYASTAVYIYVGRLYLCQKRIVVDRRS